MRTFVVFAALTASAAASASGFDWTNNCDDSGDFQSYIGHYANTYIGEIPPGKLNLRINLTADADVDVRLKTTDGTRIIWWESGNMGLLSGPSEECTTHNGLTYCYSGYNGVDGNKGQEWISIEGITNTPLVMSAFGYQAGNADVDYSYRSPSCKEVGEGSFTQYLGTQGQQVFVGTIPAGKHGVEVSLDSSTDLDINLYHQDNALILWDDVNGHGQLHGPGYQELEYEGMTITWSGYNGINGQPGHERVTVDSRVNAPLDIKAYAFQTGTAEVEYSWGAGVGEACGGFANQQCDNDLTCKLADGSTLGFCHTENWCLSDETAASDCANVIHPMVVGEWECPEFECVWAPSMGQDRTGDKYNLTDLSIDGDTLNATVTYSGGCRQHDFTLEFDENTILESYPVQIYGWIDHDANGDLCKAFLTKDLKFDLKDYPFLQSVAPAYIHFDKWSSSPVLYSNP